MADRKISQFNQQTSIPSGSFFSFIYNGQNYKLSDVDFFSALGVTGTLEQEGNPLGTPVLNPAGTVNNIRNIEPGPGIKSSVSPFGGVYLEHNFVSDNAGIPVFFNITEAQPKFRSIQAGNGIGVTSTNGTIVITATDAPVSNKTVVVNELADLPTPSSGVIMLDSDREYLFTNDINLGTNRLVLQANTAVKGTESILITLTYTGTGDMFTMSDTTNRIANIRLNCPTARVLNWSSVTQDIFRMNDVTVVACDKFGVLDSTGGSAIVRFTNVSPAVMTTDGIEFIGNFTSFYWNVSAFGIDAGAMFNLGTATFDSFIADTAIASLNGSSNLLSGATDSDNINTGGSGLVTIMRISGTGTPLSGVTVDDALWEFKTNDDIADTRADGLLSLQSNVTATVISSTGVPVLIAGAWVVETESQFTGDANGRLEYNGGKDAKLPITGSVTVAPVSGGTKIMSVLVAVNGTVVSNSKRSAAAASGGLSSITIPWQENLSTGDYVELFVANEDDTTNLLVSSAVLRVN